MKVETVETFPGLVVAGVKLAEPRHVKRVILSKAEQATLARALAIVTALRDKVVEVAELDADFGQDLDDEYCGAVTRAMIALETLVDSEPFETPL